ncbi:hypothetical protein D1872_291290 [compost metagenome]
MPSTAPASYSDLSTVCSPAMKARNPVPRLSHSWTRIRIGIMYASVFSHWIGSSRMPHLISRPFAMP